VNISKSDNEILGELACGDSKAIENIYRECYGQIEGLIMKNNGTSDDARDVFQEAMIVLYENAKSGSFSLSCQVKTYMYAVCRRLWLKRLQVMQRYTNGLDHADVGVNVDEDIEEHERKNAEISMMEGALNKIGEPCKSLLKAFYFEKKNMPEIAEKFGYTNADNAKNQKYKCLVRLKKLFFSNNKNGG